MASIPLSTMSSARKSVRKHGLGVMENQMGGMSALPLNLLFVIKGILQFSHDLTSLRFIRKKFQTQEDQNPFRKKAQEVTSPTANRK